MFLGNSQKAEDEDEMKTETTILLEQLDHLKNEKKRFLEERVCAPSPILAYSKATQLSNILTDGENKDRFMKIVAETWLKAIT